MSDICDSCGYDWTEGDALCRSIDEKTASFEQLNKAYMGALKLLVERDKLITELCDALARRSMNDQDMELVERAREAAKS